MFCLKWHIFGLILPHFEVHFSQSPTTSLILVKEKKKKKVRVCDFLGPADQGGGRLFSRFAVIQKLLTENKMDILLRTDYTYGGHFSTSLQEVSWL